MTSNKAEKSARMSSTVNKALSLLGFFTEATPEWGLSDMGRVAALDKATVHRLLHSLTVAGLLEQHPHTKLYRLGAGVLRLARIREATFPLLSIVQPILEALSDVTGETAHASLDVNGVLSVIGVVESRKSNRVSLRASESLPLHATASGLALLAFSPEVLKAQAFSRPLDVFTSRTIKTKEAYRRLVLQAAKVGYAEADQSFEDEVYGLAAPFFGPDGWARGAVAVATPCHRLTSDAKALIVGSVMKAALDLTRRLGHEPPVAYINLCSRRAP